MSLLKHTSSLKHNNNYEAFKVQIKPNSHTTINCTTQCTQSIRSNVEQNKFTMNFTTSESNSKVAVPEKRLVNIEKDLEPQSNQNLEENVEYIELYEDKDESEEPLSDVNKNNEIWLHQNIDEDMEEHIIDNNDDHHSSSIEVIFRSHNVEL